MFCWGILADASNGSGATSDSDPQPLPVVVHCPPEPGELGKFCMVCHEIYSDRIQACLRDGTILIPATFARESVDPDLKPPTAEGYEILSLAGRGNTSVVFRARTVGSTDDPLVMKILAIGKNTAAQTLRNAKRFKQEEEYSRRLSHPNIATFHDSGSTSDGRPYQVYEYVDGPSLDQVMRRGLCRFPIGYFVTIFSQICDGLQHAHECGVFHQDLKPNDVLMMESSENGIVVKIIDLGKGSPLLHGDNRLEQFTERGEIFGDPRYLAPETCWKGELDARSNVYSVGSIMYEAIAGRPPCDGANWFVTISSKGSTPPSLSPQSSSVPGIPELEHIIFKCLTAKPDDRYQSMKELKVDIAAFFERHGQGDPAQLKLHELIA